MKNNKLLLSILIMLLTLIGCTNNKEDIQKLIDSEIQITSLDIPYDSKEMMGITVLDYDEEYVYYKNLLGGAFPNGGFETLYRTNRSDETIETLFETGKREGVLSVVSSKDGLYTMLYNYGEDLETFNYTISLFADGVHSEILSGSFTMLTHAPILTVHRNELYAITLDSFESEEIEKPQEGNVSIVNMSKRLLVKQIEDENNNFTNNMIPEMGLSLMINAANDSIVFSNNFINGSDHMSDIFVYNNDDLKIQTIKESFTYDYIEIADQIVYNGNNETDAILVGSTNYKDEYGSTSHNYRFTKIMDFRVNDTDGAIVLGRSLFDMKTGEPLDEATLNYFYMDLNKGAINIEPIRLFDEDAYVVNGVKHNYGIIENPKMDVTTIQIVERVKR